MHADNTWNVYMGTFMSLNRIKLCIYRRHVTIVKRYLHVSLNMYMHIIHVIIYIYLKGLALSMSLNRCTNIYYILNVNIYFVFLFQVIMMILITTYSLIFNKSVMVINNSFTFRRCYFIIPIIIIGMILNKYYKYLTRIHNCHFIIYVSQ